jgi:hypothetical protein
MIGFHLFRPAVEAFLLSLLEDSSFQGFSGIIIGLSGMKIE